MDGWMDKWTNKKMSWVLSCKEITKFENQLMLESECRELWIPTTIMWHWTSFGKLNFRNLNIPFRFMKFKICIRGKCKSDDWGLTGWRLLILHKTKQEEQSEDLSRLVPEGWGAQLWECQLGAGHPGVLLEDYRDSPSCFSRCSWISGLCAWTFFLIKNIYITHKSIYSLKKIKWKQNSFISS